MKLRKRKIIVKVKKMPNESCQPIAYQISDIESSNKGIKICQIGLQFYKTSFGKTVYLTFLQEKQGVHK